jgi:hypothetical protein
MTWLRSFPSPILKDANPIAVAEPMNLNSSKPQVNQKMIIQEPCIEIHYLRLYTLACYSSYFTVTKYLAANLSRTTVNSII